MRLRLLLKMTLEDFLKNHRALLILIVTLQIISTFAVFIVYALNLAKSEEYKEKSTVAREFQVSLSSIQSADYHDQLKELDTTYSNQLERLELFDTKSKVAFEYLLDRNYYMQLGKNFAEADFKNGNSVILAGSFISLNNYIGQTIKLYNRSYTVIGIFNAGYYQLTYSDFSNTNAKIDNINILFKRIPQKQQVKKTTALLEQLFPSSEIHPPEQPTSNVLPDYTSTIFIIGFFILSLINISFFYHYLLYKRNIQMRVMRIFGATSKQCIRYYMCEMLILSFIVYLLCSVAANFLIPSIINYTTAGNLMIRLSLSDYFIIFTFYIIVIFIISRISVKRYISQLL
jgi:ABC-type antimicrobial peptide transport system permease subunit